MFRAPSSDWQPPTQAQGQQQQSVQPQGPHQQHHQQQMPHNEYGSQAGNTMGQAQASQVQAVSNGDSDSSLLQSSLYSNMGTNGDLLQAQQAQQVPPLPASRTHKPAGPLRSCSTHHAHAHSAYALIIGPFFIPFKA